MSKQVQQMFASIAPAYDRTNSVLSLGIHHIWRKKTVQVSGAKTGMSVLDCATVTGDLALEFKKTVGPAGQVMPGDGPLSDRHNACFDRLDEAAICAQFFQD